MGQSDMWMVQLQIHRWLWTFLYWVSSFWSWVSIPSHLPSCHRFMDSALIFGFKLGFLAPCSDHQFFSNQCHQLHLCSPPSLSINKRNSHRWIHSIHQSDIFLRSHFTVWFLVWTSSAHFALFCLGKNFSLCHLWTSLSFHHPHHGYIYHESISFRFISTLFNTQVDIWWENLKHQTSVRVDTRTATPHILSWLKWRLLLSFRMNFVPFETTLQSLKNVPVLQCQFPRQNSMTPILLYLHLYLRSRFSSKNQSLPNLLPSMERPPYFSPFFNSTSGTFA